jgi:hypothetical protein
MESDSVNYGAQYKASETIGAGREETSSITQINSMESQGHVAAAWQADAARQHAVQMDLRGTLSANQTRYGGSIEAIQVRHEAALAAARMRATAQVLSSIGSIAASQMQSVFQQTNRY